MCQHVDSMSHFWNLMRDYIPIYFVVNIFLTYINKILKTKVTKKENYLQQYLTNKKYTEMCKINTYFTLYK